MSLYYYFFFIGLCNIVHIFMDFSFSSVLSCARCAVFLNTNVFLFYMYMLILAHRIFYNPNDTTLVLYSSLLGLGSPKAALALDSAKAARLPVPATAYCCDSISAFGGAGGNAKSPVSPLAMVGVVVCHFKACLALSSFSICFTLACFLATASSCRFTCHPPKKRHK